MATELFKLMGRITIEMDDAESDLKRFETLLTNAVTALESIDTKLTTVNTSLNTMETRLSNANAELKDLDSKATSAREAVNTLDGEVTTLNGTMNTADTRINAVVSELTQLDSKSKTAGTQLTTLDGQLSVLHNPFSADGALGAGAVWLGNMLEDLAYKVVDLSWDFLKIGIDFNASAETYKASLKTMLGLTEKETEAVYEKLYNFAKETPYSMTGVMDSAVKLFNSGMGIDDTMKTLSVLGDLAGGNSEKLTRLIKAYTDTKGYGFLRAQERNQFVENEVLLYDLLSDYYKATGKGKFTADELAVMQSKKAISDEDVWAALEYATSEEGRYFNYMATLMNTWSGRIEKTGDTLNETAGAFTLPIFETLKNETLPEATRLMEEFKEWATQNETSIKEVAETISAIAIEGLDGLSDLLGFYIENKDLILPVFSAIAIALTSVFLAAHPLVAVFAAINAGIIALINNREELDNWLINSSLGGVVDVTEKEGEVRGLTHEYLKMSSSDYENDEAYQAARIEKLGQIEKSYADLVMRVAASENKEELAKNLGMDTSEYLSLIQADIRSLYTEGTVLTDLKLLNTLSTLWYEGKNGNTRDALGIPGQYYEDPYTRMPDGTLLVTNPDALEKEQVEKDMDTVQVSNPFTLNWWKNLLNIDTEDEEKEKDSGSLNRLRENMHNLDLLFASASGMPDRSSNFDYSAFGDRGSALSSVSGSMAAGGIVGLIASVQGLTAAVQSMTGEIPSAISAGVGNITVTGHVTTGNVTLDTGAIVGQIAPRMNLALGGMNMISGRG